MCVIEVCVCEIGVCVCVCVRVHARSLAQEIGELSDLQARIPWGWSGIQTPGPAGSSHDSVLSA